MGTALGPLVLLIRHLSDTEFARVAAREFTRIGFDLRRAETRSRGGWSVRGSDQRPPAAMASLLDGLPLLAAAVRRRSAPIMYILVAVASSSRAVSVRGSTRIFAWVSASASASEVAETPGSTT